MANNLQPEGNILTEGVATLLGDPKKAVLKLSLPMVVAMSVQSLYNLADKIWVSGLGREALSATGIFFPFMMLAIALSTGLGIGGGSAISRRIGAADRQGANNVATHTVVFTIILSIIYAIPLYSFAYFIFNLLGAGQALEMSLSYGQVMFAGSIFIFLANIGNSLLRSEGKAKKAMFAILTGVILNVVLDPLFIYQFTIPISSTLVISVGLNWGVAGAAYATILSYAVSCLLLAYWIIIKKDNYVELNFKQFHFRKEITKDIFRVALPSTLAQGSMSLMMMLLNLIVTMVAGYIGVAIFQTGWTVVSIATLPLLGIASAVTAVSGATFGARLFSKLKQSFLYAVKLGIIIESGIALLTLLFAPLIAQIFALSGDTRQIIPEIIFFLQVIWIFYPAVSGGMLSSAFFQGVGKGFYSLLITVIRTLVLASLFSYFLSITLKLGLLGVYLGIIISSWGTSIIAFTWARHFIKNLILTENKK